MNKIFKNLSELRKWKKIILIITASLILIHYLFFTILHFIPFKELNDFREREVSTTYFDSEGRVVYVKSINDGLRRQYTDIKDIPSSAKKAFIHSEDKRFYFHNGVDYISVLRAFLQNKNEGRTVSGASTITMQLARMVTNSKTHSYKQKLTDVFNAYRIEAKLSKKEILNLYLNNIPFSNNVEGITSASFYYFGKTIDELEDSESYILSVIPRSPSLYNPIDNPSVCSSAAYKIYKSNRIKVKYTENDFFEICKKVTRHQWPFQMNHFIQSIKNNYPENTKRIDLTLDLDLQKYSEFSVMESIKDSTRNRIENASILVIENETGNILCYVGSQNFYDEKSGQIDGVKARNQMGSSMKPFLYAACIEEGVIKPNQILSDIPMEFGSHNIYIPMNFNDRFNGPMPVRTCLASSLNIPAVYIQSLLGTKNYLNYLYNLGFDSLKEEGNYVDLGLSLGAGEVSLYELTRAFMVFANDGLYKDLNYINKIDNKTLKTSKINNQKQIYSKDTARIICSILKDKEARALGFGYVQSFMTEYPSIFKTGTANQYQNIVAIGSTSKYTVGVWMGNFSGNTVIGKTGSSLPAKTAKEILDFLRDKNNAVYEDFKEPEGYQTVNMCTLSGMAASPLCPSVKKEYVKNEEIKDYEKNVCIWHKKDSNGEVATFYPSVYQNWLNENITNSYIDYSTHQLKITTPSDGSYYYLNKADSKNQWIEVAVIGGANPDAAEEEKLIVLYDEKPLTINGQIVEIKRPFNFNIPVEKGEHKITVILNNQEDSVSYSVE